VNTFLREKPENPYLSVKLTRTPLHEKDERLKQLYEFQLRNREMSAKALERLREVALGEGNIFKELLNTVQWASLGQITGVLYEIGGKYRRGF